MAERLALTREEYKKLKEAEQGNQTETTTATPAQTRAIPIWLRFVIFVVLIFVFALAGALVGYSGISHGKAADVLRGSAFTHIYDLIEKK